jgi:hypothetical protein
MTRKVESESRLQFMNKYKVHIIWAVIAVIALAGGIFYGKNGTASTTASRAAAVSSTRGNYAGRASGGGFISGQVISSDSSSVTISLAGGNSQVVFYASSTPITVIKPTPVPASSLAPGTRVMITGTSNSDGSLTAQSIQIQTGNSPSGGRPSAVATSSGQ